MYVCMYVCMHASSVSSQDCMKSGPQGQPQLSSLARSTGRLRTSLRPSYTSYLFPQFQEFSCGLLLWAPLILAGVVLCAPILKMVYNRYVFWSRFGSHTRGPLENHCNKKGCTWVLSHPLLGCFYKSVKGSYKATLKRFVVNRSQVSS